MGCLAWVIWLCFLPLAMMHTALFLIWIVIPLFCGGGKSAPDKQ